MGRQKITISWRRGNKSGTTTALAGQTLYQLVPENEPGQMPVVAAMVGNLPKDLAYPLFCDAEVTWLDGSTPMGRRILQNSLAFLLSVAVEEQFPGYRLHIFHSLRNGRFCRLMQPDGSPAKLTEDDISRLRRAMLDLARVDLPISKVRVTREDAISYFAAIGDNYKAATLRELTDRQVTLHTLNGVTRHMFSKLVPRTSLLTDFNLAPFENGFILADAAAQPLAYPKTLNATLSDYDNWMHAQGVRYCSDLNAYIRRRDYNSLIIMAENNQTRSIQNIADAIREKFPTVRLVLIAGPSSSGKTSFCNRLAIELRSLGLKPITLSMDNYFRNNADLPPAEDGQPDFEDPGAIDVPLFNHQLTEMLAGRAVEMPVFDFISGSRSRRTIPVELGSDHILLVEGIHGLNEELTREIPAENKLKIYISCMTALNLDNLTPISTSDNREIRRLVRDVKFRGISAEQTLLNWQKVRRGEERHIFPYQDAADFYFNTSLAYEFSLLAPLIKPKLLEISEHSPAYAEARRLLALVNCFIAGDGVAVPAYSLVQEFLGNSIFEV